MFVSGAGLTMIVNIVSMSHGVFQHALHVDGWGSIMEEKNEIT